ncbi:STAS domain-containing protein [Trujillonella endophytica]|uniref:Anti-anti-sigma regulatory factor (Antagonist of anti-sigma factor) n=1 Tax=Trujillonella endophytica TaxID=673521 RepID=A0A1H8PNU3_9ACTN|nr:STAS domain-containing protein [Trujillella endophytica]SEO43378.1 Anti-anti-sigma regulatory factor (antagonist of anti-sigma factor) [Trujillella endophytica]
MSLSDLRTARGVVRLLNSGSGGVLCLAGEVDVAAVSDFVRRYGREPARVTAIDAGSVTALSPSGLEILLDHLEAARRSGAPADLRTSPAVTRGLAAAGVLREWWPRGDAACAPSR